MSSKEVNLKIDMHVQAVWNPSAIDYPRVQSPSHLKVGMQFQFTHPFLDDIKEVQYGMIAEYIEKELRKFVENHKATDLFDAASKANPLDRLAKLDEELGLL